MKQTLLCTTLLALLAVLFTVAACSDREKEPLSSLAASSSTSGQVPPGGNYYPLALGTKWVYDIGGGAADTTQLVRDSIVAGQAYKYFKTGTSDYFARQEGAVYYRREVNGLAIPDASGTIERIELHADYGVGQVWNDDFSLAAGGRLRYENVLVAIEKERYVRGVKCETVLKVRTRVYKTVIGGQETIDATFYNYYAKNKGLVETISDLESKRLISIGF